MDIIEDDRGGASTILFSGTRFFHLDPRPEEILIEDIAHASSLICRWNGHSRVFFSLAQHCLLVSSLIQQWGYSFSLQLYGLLHDASEAYLGDLSSTFKKTSALAGYRDAETVLHQVIVEKFFGFNWGEPDVVKVADRHIACLEYVKLIARSDAAQVPEHWPIEYRRLIIPSTHFYPLTSQVAERMFLARFRKLMPQYKNRYGVEHV